MKRDFYKDEVYRLRVECERLERENHRYRNAISDFCEAWDSGLGGDSAYAERLRRALANGRDEGRAGND